MSEGELSCAVALSPRVVMFEVAGVPQDEARPAREKPMRAGAYREMRTKTNPPNAPATICARKPGADRAPAIGVIS